MTTEKKELSEQTLVITRLLQSRYGDERGWKTQAAKELGMTTSALSDVLTERYKYGEAFFDKLKKIFPDFVPLQEITIKYVQEVAPQYSRGSVFTLTMPDNGLHNIGIYKGDDLMIDLQGEPHEGSIIFVQIQIGDETKTMVRKLDNSYIVSECDGTQEMYSVHLAKIIGVVLKISRSLQ